MSSGFFGHQRRLSTALSLLGICCLFSICGGTTSSLHATPAPLTRATRCRQDSGPNGTSRKFCVVQQQVVERESPVICRPWVAVVPAQNGANGGDISWRRPPSHRKLASLEPPHFNSKACRQSRGNSVFHLAPYLPVVALYRIDVATWPDGMRDRVGRLARGSQGEDCWRRTVGSRVHK